MSESSQAHRQTRMGVANEESKPTSGPHREWMTDSEFHTYDE